MAKQILTPLVLVPSGANTSGLQLSKLLAGGAPTLSSPIGVDGSGNVVLSGYSSPGTITVNFAVPLPSYSFSVTIGGAQVGMNVICSISGDYPGSLYDEFEMEPLVVSGFVTATNTVVFTVACSDAMMLTMGQKKIIYQLG